MAIRSYCPCLCFLAFITEFKIKLRKAGGFKSLRLSSNEMTQMAEKCQISLGLGKISTCSLIQLYLLKR